jgi:hypothetical protein
MLVKMRVTLWGKSLHNGEPGAHRGDDLRDDDRKRSPPWLGNMLHFTLKNRNARLNLPCFNDLVRGDFLRQLCSE